MSEDKIKISSLELENVKRVKAIQLDFDDSGLTVIGGKNGEGKTSTLDGICYALGGEKFRPSNLKREGSMVDPKMKVTLSNGLIATRDGKSSSLKVIDPNGIKAGQTLINSFIGEFSLNLPKFMNASSKEKAESLLKIIGVGSDLMQLDRTEKKLLDDRLVTGRTADQKRKYALEMPCYDDVPEKPVTAKELIQEQQEILARNGENQAKRQHISQIKQDLERERQMVLIRENEVLNAEKALNDAKEALQKAKNEVLIQTNKADSLVDDLMIAEKSVEDLNDESTEEIERKLDDIEEINSKVRANLDKEKAELDSHEHQKLYDDLSVKIDEVRKSRMDLLASCNLPLPGLSVENAELTYNGKNWDCMSASEQIIVAIAITKELSPQCGFVLLDKLEQLDIETMESLSEYLKQEDLQVIATRVSTGEECSVIIEDGEVDKINFKKKQVKEPEPKTPNTWDNF